MPRTKRTVRKSRAALARSTPTKSPKPTQPSTPLKSPKKKKKEDALVKKQVRKVSQKKCMN